ncbi:MAG: mannose-1-phosphate guanylyltransferase/mannose-6-phosphate isomerase [Gammaproteobacteria bacterium]
MSPSKNTEIVAVILCGGSGTRLWPLSRRTRPKQFLKLLGERSLFQETILRARKLASFHSLLIATQEEHRFLALHELAQAGVEDAELLLEPVARNTAPALAAAAIHVARTRPDALILAFPSDHYVEDEARLAAAVDKGIAAAQQGTMVVFGVRPSGPHTGYGYIRKDPVADANGVYRVVQFKEKPDVRTATAYVADGNYLWNSGIHLLRPDVYLRALERHAPAIAQAVAAAARNVKKDGAFLRLDRQAFGICRGASIEHAVLEHAKSGVAVVELDTGWSDLGSWASLLAAGSNGADDNATHGDVLLDDVSGSYVYSSGRLVAAVGLRDQVVVETPDAVLVAPMNRAQDVKQLVITLQAQGWREAESHLRVYRPWGWYECLNSNSHMQVKRIQVMPGASLSLQLHRQRSEHWLVVRGEAEVTLAEDVFTLREDESVHVPLNTRHRLANKGESPLEVIEIQRGAYLGEDDIVRFEDDYGRAGT